MKLLEYDLEEAIFNANPKDLEDRGFYFRPTIKKRQLRIGNYGIADIVGITRPYYVNGVPVETPLYDIEIVELKKEQINISTLLQVIRYARGIQRYLEQRKDFELGGDYRFIFTLIGKTTSIQSDLIYLPNLLEYNNSVSINIFTYEFDINGFTFEQHYGYKLQSEGFKL